MAETSTLVTVDSELELGDVIDVVSASPRFDPAVLAAATATDAGDPIFLDVPDDLPDVVAATAAQVTAGSTSAYDSALLLQGWFRTEFEYSLEVQSGHGNNAIENFLRDRIGYCEQFAGTYAAMMRTLGIPARVAVGFTSGTQTEPGVYSVLGKNAHAWPEVWFDGVGWVAFEPTPGRGAPGAENYTGLEPQQDTSGADASPGDVATVDVPATTVPLGAVDQQFDPNIPEEFADPTGADQTTDDGGLDREHQRWSTALARGRGSCGARRRSDGRPADPGSAIGFGRASARTDVEPFIRGAGRRRRAGCRLANPVGDCRRHQGPLPDGLAAGGVARRRGHRSDVPAPKGSPVSTRWAATDRARCATVATGRDRSIVQ